MQASLDPHPVTTEPPSLYAMLAARARRSSDATLASLAGAGVVATLLLVALGTGAVLVTAFAVLGFFLGTIIS